MRERVLQDMTLAYSNPYVRLYRGDSRHLPLEDGSVSCVVTSPPYLGLRAYAGDQELIWDEPAEGCEHAWGENIVSKANDANRATMEWTTGGNPATKVLGHKVSQGQFCQRCGAWCGAFGLEPSPALYIQHLMVFMDEIWRVLRADGVVFVNLGDSYASSPSGNPIWRGWSTGGTKNASTNYMRRSTVTEGIRPKSLLLIPERFALACQERGWIVRSRIVWAKPNPMPESVSDRPTDAWEHIWMLTKSEKYWWDQEAVREPLATSTLADSRNDTGRHTYQDSKWTENGDKPSWYRGKTFVNPEQGRNLRNVWTINTEGFPDAHFAVFPTAIPERCILAACPPAICTVCGVPRERIVDKKSAYAGNRRNDGLEKGGTSRGTGWKGGKDAIPTITTLGWSDCGHNSYEPGLVLDPFSGSGTTAMVAQQLGRRAVGVDLSGAYLEMARKRLAAVPLPMAVEV